VPISPYLRELRARVGPARLLLPSVTAIIYDVAGAILLVRDRETGLWTTPGGFIEPDERPADAVVREAWEETGLFVTPVRVLAVYGGPEFVVRYPNGDEAQYVMTVFECAVRRGTLRADDVETSEARYWRSAEAASLPLAPWLHTVLAPLYERQAAPHFHPSRWQPDGV
jgi:ADP-ribose pyrophosphatase YjhB (NUDIX family)